MTADEIETLANDALDAAALTIQERLGVKTGDFAGLYFSGDRLAYVLAILADYIRAEVSHNPKG